MDFGGNPLVSVILPTYNHAHFLRRSIKSVIEQTYTNWELLVIDNCSDDDTEEVVAGFRHPNVQLLKIRNNGVIAASRNMGIRAAKGRWLGFLDSDDYWYERRLETVVARISTNKSHSDVYSTDELQVDRLSGKSSPLRYGPYCDDFYRELLTVGNCLSPSATLVSQHFLAANSLAFRENQEFVTAEDYDFWMLLAKAGGKFTFIPSIQGEYTIHGENSTSQVERHRANTANVVRDHVFNMQEFCEDRDGLWREIQAQRFITAAKNSIAAFDVAAAARNLHAALAQSPAGFIKYATARLRRHALLRRRS